MPGTLLKNRMCFPLNFTKLSEQLFGRTAPDDIFEHWTHVLNCYVLLCYRNYSKIMNRPQLKITPGALVCNEAEIIGDVTIGVRTVIHPKASIIAEKGTDCSLNETLCAIWYRLYNLKNLKNTHRGVLLLVKLQALLKVTFLRGCFSLFLNCTNGIKSRKTSHIVFLSVCLGAY